MSRRRLLLIFFVGLLVFLVVSALLARGFSVDGAERAAITNLVDTEASGDRAAMTEEIRGCAASAACRSRVAEDSSSLRRPGKVSILELNTSASFSVASTTGTARVAWRAGSALPVVQCVRVRHAGNLLSGFQVELLELSRRIRTDADCPARY